MALRGSYRLRVDDRSRVKIPAEFRRLIEEKWGTELYVTSLDGREARIFPVKVWEAKVEAPQGESSPFDPDLSNDFFRFGYYGQHQTLDAHGRVLIHSPLRESADLTGDVIVLGFVDHLRVWNAERADREINRQRESGGGTPPATDTTRSGGTTP